MKSRGNGGTALHCAAWQGSAACVDSLLRHPSGRALIEVRDPTYDATPLGWCCHGSLNNGSPRANFAQVARSLLAAGGKVDGEMNASDAVKDHEGIIRVTTRCVTVDHDTDGATSDCLAAGEYVELAVSDTGIGMSPQTQARVFDPFFTTKSAGRGLGLAVVHGIVRSLNGAIRVISEFRKGTTFQILLPCAGAADGATADTAVGMDERAAPSREATVLVVEDEHPLRLALTKMLGKAGFRVLQVDNGSEAIELLHADIGEIDAILLDMTIPGALSQEVLAEAVQVRPTIKTILTSAYSEETARKVLNGPQIGGFIRKPFRFDDLVRTLRSALSSNSAA